MRHLPFALATLTLAVTPAFAVNCGDVITSKTILTADIGPCDSSTDPAITIVGSATLDMIGKTLLCDDGDRPVNGVLMDGKSAKLENGVIRSCGTAVGRSIYAVGEGSHKITNMLVDDGGMWAVEIRSSKVKLKGVTVTNSFFHAFQAYFDAEGVSFDNCAATDNPGRGFNLIGPSAKVKRSVAAGNGFQGFYLGGEGIKIDQSTAIQNGLAGFFVSDAVNISLAKNQAVGNQSSGFVFFDIDSSGKAIGNVILGNSPTDFEVQAPACAGWLLKKNVFGTANDPCVQ